MNYFEVLFFLIVGHALADYPLQGEFLSQAKNRNTQIGKMFWPHALASHSFIHGGFVAAITGSVSLGVAEAVVHGITDWLKCESKISLNVDQGIHIFCKVVWALIALEFYP